MENHAIGPFFIQSIDNNNKIIGFEKIELVNIEELKYLKETKFKNNQKNKGEDAFFIYISDYYNREIPGTKKEIYYDLIEILKIDDTELDLSANDLDKFIRIRSESFEHQVRFIRVHLGNLSKEMMNPFLFSTKLIKWVEQGIDPMPGLLYKIFLIAK